MKITSFCLVLGLATLTVANSAVAFTNEKWIEKTITVPSVPSLDIVSATAECPNQFEAFTGGFSIAGSSQRFVVIGNNPTVGHKAWRVDVYNRTTAVGGVEITVYALCAKP
jgi:hypothetical protein